ncbi:protein SAR DEFICIENT 1-like isoform X2 [Durio zibethinus]|uniref:Protein SAR DEFICIENT 1-like isoform X2 n=1 Tax=Durio zibethinus TaxID=66656 RepID=A0A6P5Y4S4_DURZI|nr:protein SAR DEFICIENT 1-like isoform X2 [Durio zibethinus]
MAAKRLLSESCSDPDEPKEKRMRPRPSFASVIGEAVMVNCLCSALEPVLRRVVNEEVERSLQHGLRSFSRSPSLRIQAPEPSTLQLRFRQGLSLPIFTGSKIMDEESNQLQVLLVDTRGDQRVPVRLPNPIKVDIVVLDGDFPSGDGNSWTGEEFDRNIVRERTGKRPLLTGELAVTVRDGVATIGEIEFTDNSSWIRSRKFRIGAKVAQGSFQGVRIREAMTQAFVVKDHRGELYKKHHPPMLGDEVWRLEKIGKDGAFHKKLTSKGVNTVQDFLKMWVVDPAKLRRAYLENLVRQAYVNWSSLEEIEGISNEIGLLTQGGHMVDPYPNHQQIIVRSFQQNGYLTDSLIAGNMPSEMQADGGNWQISQTYLNTTPIENGIRLNILESNSDDDLTSPRSFITGG